MKVDFRPLSSFLKESNIKVDIDNANEYKCGGVRLNGRGIFVREIKEGASIQKQWVMHKVEKDNVVYSTLFADKGAFAIASSEDEELIFSEKFVCFKITDADVLPEYLHVIFQTDYLSAQCDEFKTGMAAFSLSHSSKKKVLKLAIPIPEPDIQRIIVKEYASFEKSRKRADDESEFLQNTAQRVLEKFVIEKVCSLKTIPLSKLGNYASRPVEPVPGEVYKQITVKLHGNGVVLRKMEDGANIKSKQTRVHSNDLIYSKIDVKSGAIGFIPEDLDGGIVTADFPIAVFPNFTDIDRKFLTIYFSSDEFYEKMDDKSKGTTNRVRTKKSAFFNIEVPWGDETLRTAVVKEYDILCNVINTVLENSIKIQEEFPLLTSRYLNNLLHIS